MVASTTIFFPGRSFLIEYVITYRIFFKENLLTLETEIFNVRHVNVVFTHDIKKRKKKFNSSFINIFLNIWCQF